MIIRGYNAEFLVITLNINPKHHYQPENLSTRSDNGQGLILRAITKTPHIPIHCFIALDQGLHRLEKYLYFEGFLETLEIKSALKSTGKSLKSLEKSLNSTIFCRT